MQYPQNELSTSEKHDNLDHFYRRVKKGMRTWYNVSVYEGNIPGTSYSAENVRVSQSTLNVKIT